jgi:hypothetical protein
MFSHDGVRSSPKKDDAVDASPSLTGRNGGLRAVVEREFPANLGRQSLAGRALHSLAGAAKARACAAHRHPEACQTTLASKRAHDRPAARALIFPLARWQIAADNNDRIRPPSRERW